MMTDLNRTIAARVKELRSGQGMSLEALAGRSGVSRSMISVIERGEASPTAVVLEKLASALGVTLASLFDPARREPEKGPSPLLRRSDQAAWRDPGSGYLRRNVSPPDVPGPFRIVEVEFPAGGRVAFDNALHDARIYQQVWVVEGTIEVRVGDDLHRLEPGDCLAMRLDRPTMFQNPTDSPARYLVVVAREPEMTPSD